MSNLPDEIRSMALWFWYKSSPESFIAWARQYAMLEADDE